MDWALGIAVNSGRLVVEGMSSGGDLETCELTDLGTCGVPTCSQWVGHGGTLNFDSLVPTSADEYFSAFDMHAPQQSPNRHMVLECQFDGARVIIPALVLMRALFRPTKFLLPVMFRAQAMDRIRFLDSSRTSTEVVVDASWYGKYGTGDGVNQCVSWMSFFPSAIRLASSVHEFAMRGEIGLSVPHGSARATMHGLKLGGDLFVTEMRVMSVHADEEPTLAGVGCTRNFVLRDVGRCDPLKGNLTELSKIPASENGELDVTDSEWAAIEPTLLVGQKRNSERLNQRHLFDAILQKISLNAAWRTLVPKSGTWNNARFAERNWRTRETLAPSLEILLAMRT